MALENKELNTALKEAENAKGAFKYTLKKPVEYNGKLYSEIECDFDKLTGEDALNIEDELLTIGKAAIVPAFSGEYMIRMAAKASTEPIGSDFFKMLSIYDYNMIRNAARSFLLRSEL